MIEAMRSEKKALKEGVKVEGSTSSDRDREAKVEAPNPHMFKGVRDAQEVENFLWHLENYFKCSQLNSDKNKINTIVMHLSEMSMLCDFVDAPMPRHFPVNAEKLVNVWYFESLLHYKFNYPSVLVEALTQGSYMLLEIPR
ncbi:hypothetical protein MTR67_000747 [Solanum verrucosum]|uniref:Uncharacterized protein n=1 Tax=Solanum verrucosum TaxID=315347 RepID=A0AAF0PMC3_SOLVR|nr:hypothetical protein MTR67_000747 [Solanum verrucosum]